MVHYTAIVLVPNAGSPVQALVASLCEAFERLLLPYEILCIDDASSTEPADNYDALRSEYPQLRVLRFDRPRGSSAALCAAIAASRGDVVLAIDANLSTAAAHVPHLISRLGRYDFVTVETLHTLPRAIVERLASWPRLLLSARRRAGEPLCFAAKRPAIAGMALADRSIRVLPEIVALRGYRVGSMLVAEGLPPRGMALRSRLVPRLIARWHSRRFEPHLALELRGDRPTPSTAAPIRMPAGHDRIATPQPNVPLGQQHGEPA
jgi:glycosyltransferase involved in cell wall biosynthesis